ncbi:nitric oxide reductase activation protein NorD [Desulfatirhabdium butyrativorans]|uniref:nitric oxide reductase activation protein NorD n=1 Tax=Desulfatirhabdium butyrativorans TaxID=340467 RepID=UPI000423F431|nr:VWA domain-containing protein [Desulfatirhabdium butyrativorans]
MDCLNPFHAHTPAMPAPFPEETLFSGDDPLQTLAVADPDAARLLREAISRRAIPLSETMLRYICGMILWALSAEMRFGQEVVLGVAGLLQKSTGDAVLAAYAERLRKASGTGPELATVIARHLPMLLMHGEAADLHCWDQTVDTLAHKGTYALYEPLSLIDGLYGHREMEAARGLMALLQEVFGRAFTYNRTRSLLHTICVSVQAMRPAKRVFQTAQARRLAARDPELLDAFFDGLESGLRRLNETGLREFVGRGIERLKTDGAQKAAVFFSLQSRSAKRRFESLRVSAMLGTIQERLRRYATARLGRRMGVEPISDRLLRMSLSAPDRLVLSNAAQIFLPEEMDVHDSREMNEALYPMLTRLEIGFHEFGTYGFDGVVFAAAERLDSGDSGHEPDQSDLSRFWNGFPNPLVAEDLFSILEMGRIRLLSDRRYPGIFHRAGPQLAHQLQKGSSSDSPSIWERLYRSLVLQESDPIVSGILAGATPGELFGDAPHVDQTAKLTLRLYPEFERSADRPFRFPFGWKPSPALVYESRKPLEILSRKLQDALRRRGLVVNRSRLRDMIQANGSMPDPRRIEALLPKGGSGRRALSDRVYDALREMGESIQTRSSAATLETVDVPIFWYAEWDQHTQDYLLRHVRILVRDMGEGDAALYRNTLERHAGLVSGIRRAFEMMRPQGIDIRRGWLEGDHFDYPLLVEWAVARKARTEMPERLYIKRLKDRRDVAVQLLVDLSRSTAHAVSGHSEGCSVLDVEKEAIILFCEALDTIGDRFAIAGFSGNGRHNVDYYRIKGFDDALDASVHGRISAMRPLRSTRMGAAIRHAAAQLALQAAAVRVLIVLGDGFPNDVDYKREVAVADTRKSVQEARAKGIHVHAVTVNIAADPLLDDLYGWNRHTVISDVTELPEKLVRIYSRLTKH